MLADSRRWPALPLVAVGLLATLPFAARGAGLRDLRPTESRIRLAQDREPGERLVVRGHVVDAHGAPVPGALLHVYHADARGEYVPPGSKSQEARLAGALRADSTGAFRIETVMPSSIRNLEGGPPHIHGSVWRPRGQPTPLVVNIERETGAFGDAPMRSMGGWRRSGMRKAYRDSSGVWWLGWDPQLR